MRILLVEDEPDAARMVAKRLREQSYAVDVVGDGESACDQAVRLRRAAGGAAGAAAFVVRLPASAG